MKTKHSANEILAFEIEEIAEELFESRRKHGDLKSGYKGFCALLKEMNDLWSELKKQKPDPEKMGDEARQIAAMALKFLLDIVHPAGGKRKKP